MQKCIPVMLKLVLKKGFIILQSLRRSITVGKKKKSWNFSCYMLHEVRASMLMRGLLGCMQEGKLVKKS